MYPHQPSEGQNPHHEAQWAAAASQHAQSQSPSPHDPHDPHDPHHRASVPLGYPPPPRGPSPIPYPTRSDYPLPPASQALPAYRQDRPEMATLQPQYPYPHDAYPRLPAPVNLYHPPHPQPDMYRQPQPGQSVTQSAPRQRTAIACKYCRRRKIRCSGFESSEDGRCTNCVRFSQECVFTPVSAQTQAFVPAQALYSRGARNAPHGGPPQLYGAFGQPIHPQGYPPHPGQPGGYPIPSPTHAYPNAQMYGYPAYPQPQMQPQPLPQHQQRRGTEPLTPSLPLPNSGYNAHMGGYREGEPQHPPNYAYPDPSTYTGGGSASPASPNVPFQPQPQPYYSAGAPRRLSAGGSQYPYEVPAESPHSQQAYAYSAPPAAQGQRAPSGPPSDGRTPPPASSVSDTSANRPGMSIRDMVSGDGGGGGGRQRRRARRAQRRRQRHARRAEPHDAPPELVRRETPAVSARPLLQGKLWSASSRAPRADAPGDVCRAPPQRRRRSRLHFIVIYRPGRRGRLRPRRVVRFRAAIEQLGGIPL